MCTLRAVKPLGFHRSRREIQTDWRVECVPMTVESALAEKVSVVWFSMLMVDLFVWVELRKKACFNGIMIPCLLTVWLGGSAQAAQARAIQNTLTRRQRRQIIRILPFFTEHAASTASTVKTGTIEI